MMLDVADARQNILDRCELLASTELVMLQAFGQRVLAQTVSATINVPGWDNSAMDGYAVNVADLQNITALPVSQTIAAGTHPQPLAAATVARIFTGAPVPEGADAVEMQENTRVRDDGCVEFVNSVKPGANIRRCGQDIKAGDQVVARGARLQAQHVGLLASVGVSEVQVYKPLRVAVLSTGDELAEPGEALEPGQIYNSNRYMLLCLLEQLGFEALDGGQVADDFDSTCAQLQAVSANADIVISSGGVSVGDEDHVKAAVETIGQLDLWKIAVKPGKPLAFGHLDSASGAVPFFGLPGNPVSAFVTFLLFVQPYLLKAQGLSEYLPSMLSATADFSWPAVDKKPGKREEYLRARCSGVGRRVEIYPNQSSGVLSSVSWSNCLARVPAGVRIEPGDEIEILPLSI